MQRADERPGATFLCRLAAAISLGLGLSACEYIGEDNYKPQAEVARNYQDRTMLYFGGYGAVVYYSAAGEAFIWPARSQTVFRGQWKLGEDSLGNTICTRYEPYKYNPITGIDQSLWDCALLSEDQAYTEDEAPGDPIGLARRKAMPFALQPTSHGDEIEEIAKSLPALP